MFPPTSLKALAKEEKPLLMLWFDKLLARNFISLLQKEENTRSAVTQRESCVVTEMFLGDPGVRFRTAALTLDC